MSNPFADPTNQDAQDAARFLSGKTVAAQFPKVGHSVGGTIMSFRMQQETHQDSKEPLFWENREKVEESRLRNPAAAQKAMQLLIEVQSTPTGLKWTGMEYTPEQIPDDDGVRTFYVKGFMQQAVAKALKDAKVRVPEVGAYLEVTRAQDGPRKNASRRAPYTYTARYVPAASNGDAAASFLDDTPASQPGPSQPAAPAAAQAPQAGGNPFASGGEPPF